MEKAPASMHFTRHSTAANAKQAMRQMRFIFHRNVSLTPKQYLNHKFSRIFIHKCHRISSRADETSHHCSMRPFLRNELRGARFWFTNSIVLCLRVLHIWSVCGGSSGTTRHGVTHDGMSIVSYIHLIAIFSSHYCVVCERASEFAVYLIKCIAFRLSQ